MAFDVTGLDNYKDQSSLDLLVAATLTTKTAKMARPVPKVKSAFDLHKLVNTVVAQVGGDCAFNASGTVALTARTLTTYPVKYQDNLCMATLEAKYTQMMLIAGQKYGDMEIPAVIMANIIAEIAEDLEVNDWKGTVAGAAKYDGLKTIIDAASVTEANATTYLPGGGAALTAVDETNINKVVYALQRAMRAQAPAVLEGKPVIAMPTEWFGYLQEYYLSKNYFVGSTINNGMKDADTLPLLGFPNVTIFGTIGLSGTNSAYMLDFTKNVFIGFDAEGEEYIPELWYSKDQQTHKYSIRFRRGWQIAFPNEIKKFTLA